MRFRYVKLVVFLLAVAPAGALVWRAFSDDLGANPIDALTDTTGDWTLRFVLISLAVTPLRRLTGWNQVIGLRRMLGLFAFFYAFLHFSTYLVLDQFFAFDIIIEDIAKRPYITVGFAGFVLLIPLAITSTKGWIRRLGRRWQQLHRLVYVTACAGVVHYLWLVKLDTTRPLRYAAVLFVLLGLRVYWAVQKRMQSTSPAKDLAVRPGA